MEISKLNMFFYALRYVMLFLAFALPFIVAIFAFSVSIDIKVDPEYMNGILTGSSVLFGFWIILFELTKHADTLDRQSVMMWFLISSVFLVSSVYAFALCAIGVVPSIFALLLLVESFALNACFVLLLLHSLLDTLK